MRPPEIEVRDMATAALVPYANNAKLHDTEQVGQIAASIREFGFNDPVAVWLNGSGETEIVEGHGRVLAAQRLGLDEVPVFYLNHLTDEQRRAYTHVHNQTTLSSGWDTGVLDAEISALDFDWESFGFDLPSPAPPAEPEDEISRRERATPEYKKEARRITGQREMHRKAAERFAQVTSGTWEREKKRRSKAAEGWLGGKRRK